MEPDAPTVIIAVGDELVRGFTLDTNSHWLAVRLRDAGWPARRIEVIGDSETAIVASIRRAVDEPGVLRIIVCGGMGPTPDDVTMEGVAAALGRPLVTSPEAVRRITAAVARMHAAGLMETDQVAAPNMRMTLVPADAALLENRRGSASPVAVAVGDDRWLFVVPGVPPELQATVAEVILPAYFTGRVAETVVELRFSGIPESRFSEAMETVAREFPSVHVGSYPQTAARELIIRMHAGDPAMVASAAELLRSLVPRAR
jgi:molybdenum cofactor synthesis domain-containing protein